MIIFFKISQFIRFISAGGLGVLVYYFLLYTLTDFIGVKYIISALIASIANLSINFVLQKFWTFKNKSIKNVYRQVVKYLALAVAIFTFNLILLYIIVEYAHLQYLLAQFLITILLTIISYLASRLIFVNY